MKIFSKNSLPLYIDKIINLIEKVLVKKKIHSRKQLEYIESWKQCRLESILFDY